MATALNCVVAVPTRELFAGKVYYANIPSVNGLYGVLPGHEMIVAANRSGGVLTLNLDEAGNDQKKFLLYEGASQVYNDVVTVLGRFGKNVEDIDVDEVEKSKLALSKRIEDLEKKDKDDKQAQTELETSRVRMEWYQMQIDYAKGVFQK